jgi:hypothetical protein
MALSLRKTYRSARHGIPYSCVPSKGGQYHWEYGSLGHSLPSGNNTNPKEYGDILDCVYEMADDISISNGIPVERAIEGVLTSECWRILPTHKRLITTLLAQ